jgi:hypothetical protein
MEGNDRGLFNGYAGIRFGVPRKTKKISSQK